jgi:hypothetical protein
MKHFIGAASVPFGLGEYTGAGVEIQQSMRRETQGSAHFSEDYKSNFLGVVFRNNYWKNDKDVSDEFRQFFQDYQKGQLKGFWPTVDKATAELGRKGEAGVKKLEQLTDFVTDYAARMGQQGLQHLKGFKRSLEQMVKSNPALQWLIDKISSAEETLVAQHGDPHQSGVEDVQEGHVYVTGQNAPANLSIDPTLQAEYQKHAQIVLSAVDGQFQLSPDVLDAGIAAHVIGEQWNDRSLAENKEYARVVLANGSSVVRSMGSSVEIGQYLDKTVDEAGIMAENSLVAEHQVQQTQNQIEYEA